MSYKNENPSLRAYDPVPLIVVPYFLICPEVACHGNRWMYSLDL
jgi:hypothetical protein